MTRTGLNISLLILLTIPLLAGGQGKEYTLNGQIQIKGGETDKYKIVFTVSGKTIKGYSVTTLQDGLGLKAAITGSINGVEHTLSFKESDIPHVTVFEDAKLDAHLALQRQGARHCLRGPFEGFKKERFVFEGTMTLESNAEIDKLLQSNETESYATAGTGNSSSGSSRGRDGNTTDKNGQMREQDQFHDLNSSTGSGRSVDFNTITAEREKVFDWNTDTCRMQIWDGEYIDGDIITLVYNGKVILSNYMLVRKKKEILLPLKEDVNMLTIIAENEGKVPPNTSQIIFYDGKLKHSAVASISKGEGAVIILRKKSAL
jgi:hypothetical protein